MRTWPQLSYVEEISTHAQQQNLYSVALDKLKPQLKLVSVDSGQLATKKKATLLLLVGSYSSFFSA